jgi:serine phosphatase RsbU (regulator of sigma subunit)
MLVLDKDVQHIQESLSRLIELRSLVVKRDDVTLSKLVDKIRCESDRYAANELKRQSIRKELAIELGCSLEQMTLSRLEAALPNERRAQVARMKAKLESLSRELRKEHLNTTLFLSECARLNSMLLNSVFGLGKASALVYDSNGAPMRQTDKAFVNLRF